MPPGGHVAVHSHDADGLIQQRKTSSLKRLKGNFFKNSIDDNVKIDQSRHNSLLVVNHHTVWIAQLTSSTLEGKTSRGLASVRFPSGGKLDSGGG